MTGSSHLRFALFPLCQWRSPEEYVDNPLNEKIDVWSLGNNLYSLLTGLYPFPRAKKSDEVRALLKKGYSTFIDPRWHNSSFAEGKLAEVIAQCHVHDPNKRMDIFTLVQLLREATEVNNAFHLERDDAKWSQARVLS